MYFVRRLRKLNIDNTILCLFYNSVVSSVLVYAISCWFDSCGIELKKCVRKFARKMEKATGLCKSNLIEKPDDVSDKKSVALITKIVNDQTHPLHPYIAVLPHGRIRMLKCRTERFHKSFVPSAIKLFNSK